MSEGRGPKSDPTSDLRPPTADLRPARPGELPKLRARLAEAEETIRAIRSGEVDVVVVTAKQGVQMFTLEGAGDAYRVLIESMNEGALTLTADKTILYANACFARMVKCPLKQVMGSSFRRFLSVADQAALQPLLKRTAKCGSKIQVRLKAGDGSQMPAQISLRPLAKSGSNRATISMVVTDITEARRNEEMLRTLTHRVVQAQEVERGRVALELHDGITQLLCGILFHSQALVASLSSRDGPAKGEAMKLRKMAGQTAEEVERIAHNLRPSVLDQLGLVAALRDTSTEFAERTGVSVELICVELSARLPAATELTLYRILQEALRNVEKHARARQVTVDLTQPGEFVQLTIKDNGIGFDPDQHAPRRNGKGGLGLLGMRERAIYVGGDLQVKSVCRTGLRRAVATGRGLGEGFGPAKAGTEIEVRIPLPPHPTAAN
jgi:two-component system NarL family sensor kinase